MEIKDKHRIKAVIFDLDDTLIPEYDFVMSGYRYMSHILEDRLNKSADEIFDKLKELSKETYSRAFDRLFEAYGFIPSPEEMRDYIDRYRNHPADVSFYPDVMPTLQGLKERDILTGIISDGEVSRQENKLKSAKGESLFDVIIWNDSFGSTEYRKPNPHGFFVMAEKMGLSPSEMVYIGDNPSKDFHVMLDMPIRTARIIRDRGIYRDRDYLDGVRETFLLDSLTDILDIIDGEAGE